MYFKASLDPALRESEEYRELVRLQKLQRRAAATGKGTGKRPHSSSDSSDDEEMEPPAGELSDV